MDLETNQVPNTLITRDTPISTQISSSTRAQRRGSRTTNACEACKKRKTKCSGPPSVCEACQKVDTFCHFNVRLDTRRKLAYKPRIVRQRQQYILEGILQILKHNEDNDVQGLIKLIRNEARPAEIANCLKYNLHDLQGRGIIPALDVDETDLVSLGLQSLFSHRAGRNVVKTMDETLSLASSEHSDFQKYDHFDAHLENISLSTSNSDNPGINDLTRTNPPMESQSALHRGIFFHSPGQETAGNGQIFNVAYEQQRSQIYVEDREVIDTTPHIPSYIHQIPHEHWNISTWAHDIGPKRTEIPQL